MAEDGYMPDAQQIAVLDWLLGGGSLTIPTGYDLALYQGVPMAGGTEVSTGGGSNYARLALTNDSSLFADTSGALKVSANAITMPATGTAGATWTFNYMALMAAGTSTCWLQLLVTAGSSGSILTGETLEIRAGKLILRWRADGLLSIWDDTYFGRWWDALFGGAGFTPAVTVKIKLYIGDPREEGVEASTEGTDYAPLELDNDGTLWSTGALLKENAVELRWPASGGFTGALGNVSHVAIYDADTDDLMLVLARPGGAAYVAEGDDVTIAAGELNFGMIQNR